MFFSPLKATSLLPASCNCYHQWMYGIFGICNERFLTTISFRSLRQLKSKTRRIYSLGSTKSSECTFFVIFYRVLHNLMYFRASLKLRTINFCMSLLNRPSFSQFLSLKIRRLTNFLVQERTYDGFWYGKIVEGSATEGEYLTILLRA